ncbi:hypothetical protein NUSPORA_02563 [Nucleospora cyclopteri]
MFSNKNYKDEFLSLFTTCFPLYSHPNLIKEGKKHILKFMDVEIEVADLEENDLQDGVIEQYLYRKGIIMIKQMYEAYKDKMSQEEQKIKNNMQQVIKNNVKNKEITDKIKKITTGLVNQVDENIIKQDKEDLKKIVDRYYNKTVKNAVKVILPGKRLKLKEKKTIIAKSQIKLEKQAEEYEKVNLIKGKIFDGGETPVLVVDDENEIYEFMDVKLAKKKIQEMISNKNKQNKNTAFSPQENTKNKCSNKVLLEKSKITPYKIESPPIDVDFPKDPTFLHSLLESYEKQKDKFSLAVSKTCLFYIFSPPEYEVVKQNDVFRCEASFYTLKFSSNYEYTKLDAKEGAAKLIAQHMINNWEKIRETDLKIKQEIREKYFNFK